MSTTSPSARTYRLLGYLALAHAVGLFGLTALILQSSGSFRLREVWVGLVTLWFLWPIVLALHAGRSAVRLGILGLLSAILLWPSLRFYNMFAPTMFGLPEGVDLNPVAAWEYFSAYRAGRAEAEKDVAAGILAIEEFGFGAGTDGQILRERYRIEVRAIAGCVVDEKILGHASGYNTVSEREIDRRIGRSKVESAREEGYKLAVEQQTREEQYSKDLAKRLSSLPPDAKIMTESIRPYVDQQPLNDAAADGELAALVHIVERCLVDSVPEGAPPFKMYVRAKSKPDASPTFEVSAQGFFPPEALWRNIYENFETLRAPRWTKEGFLSVSLDFAIRPPR